MHSDPETAFLASKQFLGAAEGTRSGMALKGYMADDETIQAVTMATLIAWLNSGGFTERGVNDFVAMIQSVNARIGQPQQ